MTQTDPGSNVTEHLYDEGGVLKKVKLNTDEYVKDIHYNEKGQRSAIWYGNGTKTSYTYDEFTFRLRRLLTVNLNNNEVLQDLNYWYDPVGNITEIQDDAQQTMFFNNSIISPTQKFIYNALYRLIEAKGRELIGIADFGNEDNWNDSSWKTNHKGNGSAVQNYTQKYTYDEVGNMLQLQHIAGVGSYTRNYSYDVNSNKLLSTEVGSNTYSYNHDARGNMTEMPHLSEMNWNTQNELKSILKGGEPTYYQYSNGERVRKLTDKGTIKEERIYLGNLEIYRKFDNASSLIIERLTVHVSDDTGRIAMLEKRTYGSAGDDNDTAEELTRYIYSNHLQSASLELDESGEIISYEEYHPYGTTSYQAMNASINAVAKRYRYTGKERDEESGLYYHGARYYVPWLGRWTAVDPLESKYAGVSSYNYGFNNPVVFNDPKGMQGEYSIHTVSQGENLTKIAESYGVDIEGLIGHNQQIENPDLIYPGDRIVIPKLELEEVLIAHSHKFPILLGSKGKVASEEDALYGGGNSDKPKRLPITLAGIEAFHDAGKISDDVLIDLYFQTNRHGLSTSANRPLNQEALQKVIFRFIEGKGGTFTDLPNLSKEMWTSEIGVDVQNKIANEFRSQMDKNLGDYNMVKINDLSSPSFRNASNALKTIVGGTQQLDIYLTGIDVGSKGEYTATIQAIIWDSYGVSEDDATQNRGRIVKFAGGETGLKAMWVLQHQRGRRPLVLGYKHEFTVKGSFRPKK